jgi:hypothetical protein
MNVKFAIRTVVGPSEKEGNDYVRYTGNDEVFRNSIERFCTKVGERGYGKDAYPIVKFKTGLDPEEIDYCDWFTPEEKKVVKDFIVENRDRIISAYGGPDVTKDDNISFWTSDRAWGRLRVDNFTVDKERNTKNPSDCLLYLGILSGAFIDLVAPSREYAEGKTGIYFYLAVEDDAVASDAETYVTKLEAQGALSNLANDTGDALFILAWCLQYNTTAFGAFSRTMSPKGELIKYHSQYIDGLIFEKKGLKKSTPKKFIEYAKLWKSTQTRKKVMTEAYIKAADYYSFINKGEKAYVTREGTILGNTIEEAVENLMKPGNVEEFERIRDLVEKKWSE